MKETMIPFLKDVSPSRFVYLEQGDYTYQEQPSQEGYSLDGIGHGLFMTASRYPFVTARALSFAVPGSRPEHLKSLYEAGVLGRYRCPGESGGPSYFLYLPSSAWFDHGSRNRAFTHKELLALPPDRVVEHSVLSQYLVCARSAYAGHIKTTSVGFCESGGVLCARMKKSVCVAPGEGAGRTACHFVVCGRRKKGDMDGFIHDLGGLAESCQGQEHTYLIVLCESEWDMQMHARKLERYFQDRQVPFLSAMVLYAMELDGYLPKGPLKYCSLFLFDEHTVIRQQVAFL